MFLGRLILDNDVQKQHDIIYNSFMTSPWIHSAPPFDDRCERTSQTELLYPADQQVQLCSEGMEERASSFHLQMPAPGWQTHVKNPINYGVDQICMFSFGDK